MDERDYFLGFSIAPGIGPKRFKQLLNNFSSAEKAWSANLQELKDAGIGEETSRKFIKFRDSFSFKPYRKRLKDKNICFITQAEKNYPKGLLKLDDTPIVIYLKGDISCLNQQERIAVVGTRKITSYGHDVTEKLVAELVSYDFIICSGLALGVDALAHRTTIENNGKTIGVLGSGVDNCYPRENLFLYNNILKSGGTIVSEYPPGTAPTKGSFPARNRIISALSLGVLVTEAGADSGALITAEESVKIGNPVFAVPGPITSKQSDGTSKLLKKGAVLVQSADDIIEKLNIKSEISKNKKIEIDKLDLNEKEKEILKILENESMSIDDLARKAKMKVTELSLTLSSLEVEGFVESINGEFRIVKA